MERGSILGVVYGPDKQPLSEVAVMIAESTKSVPDIAALTNHGGEFSFLDLEVGEYVVRAFHESYGVQDITVKVAGGKQARVTIQFN